MVSIMIGYEIMIIGNNNYHPNRICNAFPCNGMQKHFFMIISLYHIMGIITFIMVIFSRRYQLHQVIIIGQHR